MIFHNCIKCDFLEFIPVPPETPCFQKYGCPKCGELQWIKHSRINPETYSKDMIVVDEEKKSVSIKGEQ